MRIAAFIPLGVELIEMLEREDEQRVRDAEDRIWAAISPDPHMALGPPGKRGEYPRCQYASA